MRYTILGFSQEVAIDLGLTMEQLLIIRWFIDFKDSGSIKKYIDKEDNKVYYWVTYRKIISDIPIIVSDCVVKAEGDKEYKGTPEDRLYKSQKQKLKRILSGNISKVITRHVERGSNGTYLYLSLKEQVYETLICSKASNGGDTKTIHGGVTKTNQQEPQKLTRGQYIFDQTKINQLDNSPISNNKDIYCQVINYLNEKLHTKYKPTTKKTRTLISERIKDGFTYEDFVTVIDNKINQWKDTDMEQYLRPETLFGTKFEGYLNIKVKRGENYEWNNGNFKQNKGAGDKMSPWDFSTINGV